MAETKIIAMICNALSIGRETAGFAGSGSFQYWGPIALARTHSRSTSRQSAQAGRVFSLQLTDVS